MPPSLPLSLPSNEEKKEAKKNESKEENTKTHTMLTEADLYGDCLLQPDDLIGLLDDPCAAAHDAAAATPPPAAPKHASPSPSPVGPERRRRLCHEAAAADPSFYDELHTLGLMSPQRAHELAARRAALADADTDAADAEALAAAGAQALRAVGGGGGDGDGSGGSAVMEVAFAAERLREEAAALRRSQEAWAETSRGREAEREAWAAFRRSAELRRAARVEEECAAEQDRLASRHVTLEEHTREVLNQRNRQAAKRVQYSARLEVNGIQRGEAWDELVEGLERGRARDAGRLRAGLDVEAVGLARASAGAAEEAVALRGLLAELGTRLEETEREAARQAYVVSTRRELAESDVRTAMLRCDDMIQQAQAAKQGVLSPVRGAASPPPPTQPQQQQQPEELPEVSVEEVEGVDTSCLALSVTYGCGATAASRPVVRSGTLLPRVVVRLLPPVAAADGDGDAGEALAEAVRGVGVVLCPRTPGVHLTGVLCGRLDAAAACSLEEVVVTGPPGTEAMLCVTVGVCPPAVQTFTVLLRDEASCAVSVCGDPLVPEAQCVRFHDGGGGGAGSVGRAAASPGGPPHRVWVGRRETVVPPSGRLTVRRQDGPLPPQLLRCVRPLLACPLIDGYDGCGSADVWGGGGAAAARLRVREEAACGVVGAVCGGVVAAGDVVAARAGGPALLTGFTAMLAASRGGVVALCGHDGEGQERVLVAADPSLAEVHNVPARGVTHLAVTGEGRVVVAGEGGVHVWAGPPMAPEAALALQAAPAADVAAGGGLVAVCDRGGRVVVWAPPRVLFEAALDAVAVAVCDEEGPPELTTVVTARRGGMLRVHRRDMAAVGDLGVHPLCAGRDGSSEVAAVLALGRGLLLSVSARVAVVWDTEMRAAVASFDVPEGAGLRRALLSARLLSRDDYFSPVVEASFAGGEGVRVCTLWAAEALGGGDDRDDDGVGGRVGAPAPAPGAEALLSSTVGVARGGRRRSGSASRSEARGRSPSGPSLGWR